MQITSPGIQIARIVFQIARIVFQIACIVSEKLFCPCYHFVFKSDIRHF